MSDAPWSDELDALRHILLDCGLEETVKWRQPCFTAQGKNIVILGVRKEACVAGFFRGSLLDDPKGLLRVPGPNSRSAREYRFGSVADVEAAEHAIRAFVRQGVELARSGATVPKPSGELVLSDEIVERLDSDPALRTAWDALTPGRRRGYQLHVGGAKASTTRSARFERCVDRIMVGKGLRDCICGRSKRPPGCDGTHKYPVSDPQG